MLAGHLLQAIDPVTNKPLHPDQLKAEMAIVMAAGFETTSHAITWTLAALATHPEVQQTLADELTAAGLTPTAAAPVPRAVDWSDVSKLPYLSAVVKESLRLFAPAGMGTVRIAHKDVNILGYKVPKVS